MKLELGIIKGYEDGTFRPEATANRAEAAAMIWRMLPYLKKNLPSVEELKAVIQEGDDAFFRFLYENKGNLLPDYDEFRRRLSPYFTDANITLWVNPKTEEQDVPHPILRIITRGGMLDYDPMGWGPGINNLYAAWVGTRAKSEVAWYAAHFYEEVEPILITDRFAIVRTTFVAQTALKDGKRDNPQTRFRVLQFLKKENGTWKRSGYGSEEILGRAPSDKPFIPGLLDRIDGQGVGPR